nr:MAG TPA: hypothetical protein [Caudoviricetes sp.]
MQFRLQRIKNANGICKQAFIFSTIRKYDITSSHLNYLIISV